MQVRLASVGNIDRAQDPSRPLPGLRNQTATVASLEEASAACRKFISDNDLGGGNWSGGQITDGETVIGQVSYNGVVWPPGGFRLNGKPLYDPRGPSEPARPDQPRPMIDATIDVPGAGQILVGGCYRVGSVRSVAAAFRHKGQVIEFTVWVTFHPDQEPDLPSCAFHPEGDISKSLPRRDSAQLQQRVLGAIRDWYKTVAAKTLIARNQIIDLENAVAHHRRTIAHHEAQIAVHQSEIG